MTDRQQELLVQMMVKLNEASTYNRISGVLTFLWLFEVIYFMFWGHLSNVSLYFTIWLVCMVGWTHMGRKYKTTINEYKQLKEEYENTI